MDLTVGTTRHISLPELEHWLRSARPGEWVTYIVGGLLRDRSRPNAKELRKVGRAAWQAFVRGDVHLFQRKNAEHLRSWGGDPQLVVEMEYLAQKRKSSAPSLSTSTNENTDT